MNILVIDRLIRNQGILKVVGIKIKLKIIKFQKLLLRLSNIAKKITMR